MGRQHADAIEMTLSSIMRFLKSIMSIKTHPYNMIWPIGMVTVERNIVINNLSLLFVKESLITQAKGLLCELIMSVTAFSGNKKRL